MEAAQINMLIPANLNTTQQRECALNNACLEMAADLQRIDPTVYLMFLEFGQMPEICFEINNIVDRHFGAGAMSFACTGEGVISWSGECRVGIDLEFLTEHLFAFFRLFIGSEPPRVELHHISFNDSSGDPANNTRKLIHELEGAGRRV